MTSQEIGALMLTVTLPDFMTISMYVIVFAFALKLIFEDSSFEYLKILSTIIALAFTIVVSTELYKVEKVYALKDRIITVKTSSLEKSEKKEYINDFEKDIKSLENLDMNIVLGLAKFMIFGLILIMLRDIIPKLLRANKSQHNKILEKK